MSERIVSLIMVTALAMGSSTLGAQRVAEAVIVLSQGMG